jgi:phosphatidylinositol alpha-mannosyltransferase
MRIAVVSPYSWTYPGGVTRHIEALAEQLLAKGHEVRVLAPYDPHDRLAVVMHKGARPQEHPAPDYLIPLGRTVGLAFNGAVSNLALHARATTTLREELRTGGYDVVHVHEPIAPVPSWDTLSSCDLPLVATYHCFSENRITNNIGNLLGTRRLQNRLRVRIAVSEAAAWTGQRFFGGSYRIIPNGVHLPDGPVEPPARADHLRIVFVGQAVERKGLPVLLRAFEALRAHVPARLQIVGAEREEVEPLLLESTGVEVLGKVSDARKHQALREADVLCAPSLGGESFGMVLTEAFAEGTPVVASDIAGYRDVVSHDHDGILVPRADPKELAEALRDLWEEPDRRERLARNAANSAKRFAWPHVADEVYAAYEDAIAMPAPATARGRLAARLGYRAPDGSVPERPARLPSLEPSLPSGKRVATVGRKLGLAAALIGGAGMAYLAVRKIGVEQLWTTLIDSSPTWVLVGLALMCLSMIVRAVSWTAILRSAVQGARVRLRDAASATMIGVLMSATLPARLGEPTRALIMSRRVGRARENLPVVLGTIVSQTLLNVLALLLLGTVMFLSVGWFAGRHGALIAFAVLPLVLAAVVLLAPTLVPTAAVSRSARLHELLSRARTALERVRSGMAVFRNSRLGPVAVVAQLAAWVIQWLSCYVLFIALGMDHQVGLGAAAAVLFAVNVTAVVPITPSNIGVFQAACVAVLTGAYGVSSVEALGYGIVLQAVEIATAVALGMPALVKEGVSFRDVRARALMTSPVELSPRARRPATPLEAEA